MTPDLHQIEVMMTDVGLEALDLLTVDEVAARLRLSVRTVWRLIGAERREAGTGLEAVKIGTAVRVPPEAVIAYKNRLRGLAPVPPSRTRDEAA